jgi:hypothetical protein
MLSIVSYKIVFSTYSSYSYATGKLRYTYMGIFFPKVGYRRYNVPRFLEQMFAELVS